MTTNTLTVTEAHAIALRQLSLEPIAVAVVVAFRSLTGEAKWLRVSRNGNIEVANPGELGEA